MDNNELGRPGGLPMNGAQEVSAVPVGIPDADPYCAQAWAGEPYEKRIQIAALFIAQAKESFELSGKQMGLGMALMDEALVETMEVMGIADLGGQNA